MTKARILANLISDNAELADGQISVAEVVGAAPLASPTFTGTVTVPTLTPTTITGGNISGDVRFGTNVNAIFGGGASDYLNIYSDGTNKYIQDTGSGSLFIRGSDLVLEDASGYDYIAMSDTGNGGSVAIKHSGDTKFITAADGVDITGKTTTDELDLSALAASISDTAVDIFVYDTSKDSDGGAWRKRTQHTSWYNEAASATRGSRKEFPAVAVIVAEIRTVTIYDGDDPDLPMWMEFPNSGAGKNLINTGDSRNWTSVSMLNGILCVGMGYGTTAGMGLDTADFITDSGYRYRNGTGGTNYRGQFGGNIAQRRTSVYNGLEPRGVLVGETVNDVAMTVLPNAPIDAASGLPVPTIAIASDGGVSVIKDDGTVVDWYRYDGNEFSHQVAFDENNSLFVTWGTTNGQERHLSYLDAIPSSDDNQMTDNYYNSYYGVGSTAFGSSGQGILSNNARAFAAKTGRQRLFLLDHNRNNTDNSSVCDITSSYNTGWMNGAIKLATLSDTDDTDVTGSELVTNGTFDSDTSGWTSTDGNISHQSGALRLQGDGSSTSYPRVYQAITTVVGKTYTVSAGMVGGNATAWYLRVDTGSGGNGNLYNSNNLTAATNAGTFTATGTTTYIILQVTSPVPATNYRDFDNVSVRLAEEDRSVNGNGLQVFGTVTKNPVATGADLVAYGGFSNDNYLQQPYNSDLNFGTGDFCVMGWVNVGSNTSHQGLLNRDTLGATGAGLLVEYRYDVAAILFQPRDGTNVANSFTTTGSIGLNRWIFFVGVRDSDGKVQRLYLDGELNQTVSVSALNLDSTTAITRLGREVNQGRNFSGKMALWRISETVPSPEQIAKIYEDEKVLFQDGAQATLYGSSDAVTALAYDDSTDLLHVGTSAGRSVFQGLRRVDNTTDAVGAAISASNGLVAED